MLISVIGKLMVSFSVCACCIDKYGYVKILVALSEQGS